jgi:hypothetical protein
MAQSAQEMVNLYIQAEKDVLEGKTVSFNGRTFTSENLVDIRKGRQEWEARVLEETAKAAGKSRSRRSLASFYP